MLPSPLTEHAVGNYRIPMMMANELLDATIQRKIKQLDEKLPRLLRGASSSQAGTATGVA